jgi:predicted DNA-binding ribbon-helix-helix protein
MGEKRMHKTHILLEDWQYEALQSLAAQEQRSISALIREMLTSHLAAPQQTARQRLAVMEGIGTDTHATGQEHNTFLYTTQR